MEEKELELYQNVGLIFLNHGIKSMTMDNIAKQLKISKKTLYKSVKDKADLVNKVMALKCSVEECLIEGFVKNSNNAVDEIIMISKYVSSQLQQVHPSLHYDLANYYPEAFKTFSCHKSNVIRVFVENNMERGISEGLYRDNLNPKIISRLYIHKIDALFDADIFPPHEISFQEAHAEMMKYHIRGIANEKGITYMKEKLKTETINIF